jgi:hypothetical protein
LSNKSDRLGCVGGRHGKLFGLSDGAGLLGHLAWHRWSDYVWKSIDYPDNCGQFFPRARLVLMGFRVDNVDASHTGGKDGMLCVKGYAFGAGPIPDSRASRHRFEAIFNQVGREFDDSFRSNFTSGLREEVHGPWVRIKLHSDILQKLEDGI